MFRQKFRPTNRTYRHFVIKYAFHLIDAKIISTQKGLSSCHAPGWNDPPKSISNAKENSSTTPTKRLLNKRVAFPLNSTVNTSNLPSQSPVSIPPNLPPPLPSQGKTNNSSVTEASKGNEEESSGPFIHKEDSLNETLANLEVVIEKHVQSETKSQEVKKRIETMKTLWLNDKLDDNIHRKVLDLSEGL